ncbi:RagB/SusD family nutrient uptake outer membrane protein [Pedobacter sp. MC2016-14]|uniref:RagB/SusD family nutrient uptake outer membrane protein n=1 Tax=Pedobacter sp. MC2016-14 TaxID=2897327 RepID=UPI001E320B39|nr:RagB/SusD family nutrient uptake outer membrane protein [Pedobacter sp. MC2016-14]MCD0489167.1 RagB/SusD family nutrient uptake outer membrane protein [Pedobacter sp. MC2016-14]
MKNILRFILGASLLTVLFGSCKQDFLDVKSNNQFTLATYYTSYDQCRRATAPLYNIVWYEFSSQFYFLVGDGRGNNLFTPYTSGESYIRLTETGETPTLIGAFQSLYVVITQADYVINNIDRALEYKVTQGQVNACKAEARFMRGLAYWYMGSVWGNVPIVEDPEAIAKNFKVRANNFEDVLQYSIRDLEYAAQWLPDTDVPGRLTKASANAALARLYITAACYARGGKFSSRWTITAASYYTMARDAAKKVIENTKYKLMDDYEQLFRVQSNNNTESLFSLQFVPGSSVYGTGNRTQDWLAHSTLVTGGLTAYGGSVFASGELIKLMQDRVELKRRKAIVFLPGAIYDYLGKDSPEGRYVAYTKAGNGYSYPNIKKHVVGGSKDTDGAAINGNSGLAMPMIRLAEVYLLYAEAILGLNSSTTDSEALKYVNLVRERAILDPVQEVTLANLWDERRVELAMEGQFWYDMVRRAYWDEAWVLNYMKNQNRSRYYNYLNSSSPNTFTWRTDTDGKQSNEPTKERLLLPYPATELVMNPLLREPSVPFDFGQ